MEATVAKKGDALIEVVRLDELKEILQPLLDIWNANEAFTNYGHHIQYSPSHALACGLNIPVLMFEQLNELFTPITLEESDAPEAASTNVL